MSLIDSLQEEEMQTVSSEIVVKAPVAMAYRAFTNGTALREWLCDYATVDPHPRGRIYLWWNGDFYSSGHFLALEENKLVKFCWYSSSDPGASEVSVTFEEAGEATRVVMTHAVPDEAGWKELAQGFRGHWDSSLHNLKSVLETGIDQRIASRPMVGIFPGDFTPEQAEQLKVPVTDGLRLDDVVEGMGAAKAGLQKNDVIVEIDGKPIKNDAASLPSALAGKKGGDSVEVTYYRGPQKNTMVMTLTQRQMIEVPFDLVELVRQARVKVEASMVELEKCFEGVTDAQASLRPAAGGWSALDTLAHLLQGERYNQFWMIELFTGYEHQSDSWGGNVDAHIHATVSMYPTIAAMLTALRSGIEETLTVVSNLPAAFTQNKASFYRLGSTILQNSIHIDSHIPQIKAAIAAA
jgi:uncharacterized protein YndB with AHSA1/START domain